MFYLTSIELSKKLNYSLKFKNKSSFRILPKIPVIIPNKTAMVAMENIVLSKQ